MKNLFKNSKEDELISSLKSMEVNPPKGLWDAIEATLLAKRNRKIFIITSWASAATITMLVGIGGMYMMSTKINTKNSIEPKNQIGSTTINKLENSQRQIITSIAKNREKQNYISSAFQRKVSSPLNAATLNPEDLKSKDEIPEILHSIKPTVKRSGAFYPEKIDIGVISAGNEFGVAIAQVEVSDKKVKGDWFCSVSGFPVYSFHTSGALNKTSTQQESGIVSWGGSVSVRYAFSKNISLETGLTYNILGQQEKNIYLVTSDESNSEVRDNKNLSNSFGVFSTSYADVKVLGTQSVYTLSTNAINESSFNKADALQRFRYLEIPFLLVKRFNIQGISLHFKAGLSAGFLIRNQLDLKGTNLQLKGKTQGVNSFIPSALTSIGIAVPITNHVNFLIEPSFKLGLNPLSSITGKSYPFSTFVKFGIEIPI